MQVKKEISKNLVKEILEEKSYRLVDIRLKEDAELEIQNIKRSCDGFTAIGIKEALTIWHQWHIPNNELLDKINKLIGREDIYFSINSMISPLRQLKNLRHLHAFWVDLDYYKMDRYKRKTTEEMIALLREKKEFKDIEPSFFIDSGNGLYIIYLIETATIGALPIWQNIQNSFYEKFKKYGADHQSIDAVHVLRLAGTRNSKTGKIARFVFNSEKEYRFEQINEDIKIHTINDLSKVMLPELPYSKEQWEEIKKLKVKKKKANYKKEIALYNLHTLHYSRLQDIEQLQCLRKGNCTGYRELMCFLYRYYSCLFIKNEESALINLLEFNSNFINPLSEGELIKATTSAEKAYALWEKTLTEYLTLEKKPTMVNFFRQKGCYIYSNKRLIELLSISFEEMEKLKTIISVKEKNRRSKDYRNEWKKENSKQKLRNHNGLTSRQQSKLNNLEKILELTSSGLKQKEIAENLNITQQAVSKLLREYKNNTLDEAILRNLNENSHMIEVDETVDEEFIENIISFA